MLSKKKALKLKNKALEEALEEKNKTITELKKQVKAEKNNSLNKIMKNYAYAILVDRNICPGVTFYNDGREEQHIKALNFTIDISKGSIPELTIEK